jgi:hypothetical protein
MKQIKYFEITLGAYTMVAIYSHGTKLFANIDAINNIIKWQANKCTFFNSIAEADRAIKWHNLRSTHADIEIIPAFKRNMTRTIEHANFIGHINQKTAQFKMKTVGLPVIDQAINTNLTSSVKILTQRTGELTPIKEELHTTSFRRDYNKAKKLNCFLIGKWFSVKYINTTPGHILIVSFEPFNHKPIMGENVGKLATHHKNGITRLSLLRYGFNKNIDSSEIYNIDNPFMLMK